MTDASVDPFIEALSFFGKLHSRTINAAGVVQGLPVSKDGRLTPELFARAAKRAGFDSRLVRRSLSGIHPATLPVILILENNEAVILTSMPKKGDPEVIVLSSGSGTQKVSRKQLEEAYSGIAIYVKPFYEFEERSDFNAKTLKKNWFWGTLWRFKSFYARVCLATVVINFLALASSLFAMNVYDRVVPNQAVDTLYVLAIGVVIAYVFEFALKTLRNHFVDRAGRRIDLILGSEIFSRILGMRFDDRPTSAGSLASQARSYDSLREFFTGATVAALADLPFVFIFIGVIYMLGGSLVALPLLIGLVLSLVLGIIMQIPISRTVSASYASSNQRQSLLVEGIQSLERIKATRSESEMQSRMEEVLHASSKSEVKSRGYSHFAMNTTAFIQHLVSTAIIVAAFYAIVNEDLTMGGMIACSILAGRAMGPMALVASLFTRLQQSRRSLQGLDQIMQMPVERDTHGAQYLSVEHFVPETQVESLVFRYDEDSAPVVDGIDLKINAGEKIAILGRVGSGKSTLMRLLMGLTEPTAGNIHISGIDIGQFDPAELRRHIGYVPQDPRLFYGTLRSNLKSGCPWVSDDDMLRAIDAVGLAGFIRSLPRGIDQPVSEGGYSLSGGQRQSIAIARALIEQPELLIFDEPTSAMDLQSEKRFLEKLNEYHSAAPNRTVVIATHKRSILSVVERVIVMDNGKIVADGPRDMIIQGAKKPMPVPVAPVRSESDSAPQRVENPDVALPS